MQQMDGRVRALDGLRGVAVLLVFAAHVRFPGLHFAGGTGVTMFFALSGYLITTLLLAEFRSAGKISLRAFYVRRALRLLPAITVFSSTCLACGWATLSDVAWVLAYVGNWARAAGHGLGALHHTWSLSVEEQFYFIWPALVVLAGRTARPIAWLGAIALTGAVCSSLARALLWDGSNSIPRLHFGSDTNANGLLVGCTIALAIAAGWSPKVPYAVAAAAAAGIAVLSGVLGLAPRFRLLGIYGLQFTFTWAWPITALLTCVILLYARHERVRALEWRPLCWMGTISYGFYLWHMPAVDYLMPALSGLPRPVSIVLTFSASLAVSVLSYFTLERPLLRLKRRFERAHIEAPTPRSVA